MFPNRPQGPALPPATRLRPNHPEPRDTAPPVRDTRAAAVPRAIPEEGTLGWLLNYGLSQDDRSRDARFCPVPASAHNRVESRFRTDLPFDPDLDFDGATPAAAAADSSLRHAFFTDARDTLDLVFREALGIRRPDLSAHPAALRAALRRSIAADYLLDRPVPAEWASFTDDKRYYAQAWSAQQVFGHSVDAIARLVLQLRDRTLEALRLDPHQTATVRQHRALRSASADVALHVSDVLARLRRMNRPYSLEAPTGPKTR